MHELEISIVLHLAFWSDMGMGHFYGTSIPKDMLSCRGIDKCAAKQESANGNHQGFLQAEGGVMKVGWVTPLQLLPDCRQGAGSIAVNHSHKDVIPCTGQSCMLIEIGSNPTDHLLDLENAGESESTYLCM